MRLVNRPILVRFGRQYTSDFLQINGWYFLCLVLFADDMHCLFAVCNKHLANLALG